MTLAIRAARKAGALALRFFDRREQIDVREKEAHDFVSEADHQVEREILHHLKRGYPQYGVLAEESGGDSGGSDGWRWIVDPIDGTTNFLRGLPHFALSIALAQGDQVMAGLVFNPIQDELFLAERGGGAFLNDKRIRVSETAALADAFLATGFPVRNKALREVYIKTFAELLPLAGPGVRRAGSAALDLAYVAAGRYDGFWEMNLSIWDIAAGTLLVREAGGFISDFNGKDRFLASGDITAANPRIHGALLKTIQGAGVSSPSANLAPAPGKN